MLFKPKKFIYPLITIIIFIVSFFVAAPALAQATNLGFEYVTEVGLGTEDIRVIIMRIVRVALGFLGIVAVIIILYGGYLWMTAAGNEEKIAKAKRVLVNAVIGLIIILAAAAIVSFILGQLTAIITPPPFTCTPGECLGCHSVCNATGDGVEYTDGCNTPDLCGELPTCPDPGTGLPYICEIKSTGVGLGGIPEGAVSDYAKVYGWNFHDYLAGVSKVNFDGTEAIIVQCQGQPDWNRSGGDYGHITVEVPNLPVDNLYDVTVINDLADTSNAEPFRIIAGLPAPGLACLVPNYGPEGEFITAEGIRFGDTQGTSQIVFYDEVPAITYDSWADTLIESYVPNGAWSGDVVVRVAAVDSNPEYFRVTCADGMECLDGCCLDFQCVAPELCLPGEGESCDADPGTPECEVGLCQPGLICDDESCICRLPEEGESCDLDPVTPACEPGICAGDLLCDATCTCISAPVIYWVMPGDGAEGNFITIGGANFGTSAGTVIFLGADTDGDGDKKGDADDVVGISPFDINNACPNTWQDDQIIIVVPTGAVDGPIEVMDISGLANRTDDNRGPAVDDFDVNTIVRPGVCAIDPANGVVETPITIEGKGFTDSSIVEFGGLLAGGTVTVAPSPPAGDNITGVTVPSVEPGVVGVTVTEAGEVSNPIDFEVESAEIYPIIYDFDPDGGPEETYVTITGDNFGDSQGINGKVEFSDGTGSWVEANYDFPDKCADKFWSNSQIIVKVPADAATGIIRVTNSDNLSDDTSDLIPSDFIVGGNLAPGICFMEPDNGPAGTTQTDIYGERLDNVTIVTFYDSVDALSWDGISDLDGDGYSEIENIEVPIGAITGPVAVTDSIGTSNGYLFTVGECAPGGCPGQECCQAGIYQGSCMPLGECEGIPTESTYFWSFMTGTMGPKVVEDCTRSPDCALGGYSSPSPYSRVAGDRVSSVRPDDGAVVINAIISAKFDQLMRDSTLSSLNIFVHRCNQASSDFEPADCTIDISGTINIFDWDYRGVPAQGFNFIPSSDLNPNYWYRITLTTGIQNESGTALIGNDPITGYYIWQFKTKDSLEYGDAGCLGCEPKTAYIYAKDGTQDYIGDVYDQDQVCVMLNPITYSWTWDSSDWTKASVAPVSPAPNTTATALAETSPEKPAKIKAEILLEGLSDSCDLYISFGTPLVIDQWPDCPSACINAQVGARFNMEMEESTLIDNNIDLYSCRGDPTCQSILEYVPITNLVYSEDKIDGEWHYEVTFIPAATYNDGSFIPNTYYRVILTKNITSAEGKALGGLNYDDPFFSATEIDSYSWIFKTRADYNRCQLDHVDVIPVEKTLPEMVQQLYQAIPYSTPDECSDEYGQRLNPYSYDWDWLSTKPEVADLLPLRDGCGNMIIEIGEDCDDGNLIDGDGCSSNCLNEGIDFTCGSGENLSTNPSFEVIAE